MVQNVKFICNAHTDTHRNVHSNAKLIFASAVSHGQERLMAVSSPVRTLSYSFASPKNLGKASQARQTADEQPNEGCYHRNLVLTLQLLHYGYSELWPATSHSNLQKEDRGTAAQTSKGSPLRGPGAAARGTPAPASCGGQQHYGTISLLKYQQLSLSLQKILKHYLKESLEFGNFTSQRKSSMRGREKSVHFS